MYICDGAKDGRRRCCCASVPSQTHCPSPQREILINHASSAIPRCYNELKHSRSGRSPTRLRLTYVLQGA